MTIQQLIIIGIIAPQIFIASDYNGNYPQMYYQPISYDEQSNSAAFRQDDVLKFNLIEATNRLEQAANKLESLIKAGDVINTIVIDEQPPKNFYGRIQSLSTLIKFQNSTQDYRFNERITRESRELNNYLQNRKSWFSFSNPFLSSLLKVGTFGVLTSIIGCVLTSKNHLILPSIFFNSGFFIFQWIKNHASLSKKQKAFDTSILPYLQQTEWKKHSNTVAANKQQFQQNTQVLLNHGLQEFNQDY